MKYTNNNSRCTKTNINNNIMNRFPNNNNKCSNNVYSIRKIMSI